MRKEKNHFRYLIVLLLITASVMVFSFISFLGAGGNMQFDIEAAIPFNQWQLVQEEGSSTPITLPTKIAAEANETVQLTTTLPHAYLSGMSLCIRTSHQKIKIYIDNQLIYSQGCDLISYPAKSIGSFWNVLRIPDGTEGKTIMIELTSPYSNFSGRLPQICYGSRSAILFDIWRSNWKGFVMAIILLIIAMLEFIIWITTLFKKNEVRQLFYLSLFSIFVSFWLFAESKLLQFFFSSRFFISNLAFISLMIFPIPLLAFIDHSFTPSGKRLLPAVECLMLLNVIVSCFLQYFKLADFFELLFLTHICIVLAMLVVVYSLVTEIFIHKNKQAKKAACSLIILLLFSLIELISFYLNDDQQVTSFMRIGLLIYILSLGYSVLQGIQQMNMQAQRTKVLEEMAYHDSLTHAFNSRAFYRDAAKLFDQQLGLVLFDLNDLKLINDTYGHHVGDEALTACSRCIEQAFGSLGSCYRIGGDEFSCLIPHYNEVQLSRAIKKFQNEINQVAEKVEYPFQIAYGYAKKEEAYPNFQTLLEIVDQHLYQVKNEMKLNQK